MCSLPVPHLLLTVKGKTPQLNGVSDFLCKSALIYMPVMLLRGPSPNQHSTQNTLNQCYIVNCLGAQPERHCLCVCVYECVRGEELNTQQKALIKATITSCMLVKAISDPKCTAVTSPICMNESLRTINRLQCLSL